MHRGGKDVKSEKVRRPARFNFASGLKRRIMSIFFNRFRRIPIFFASILVALFVCPGYSNQITSEEYTAQRERVQTRSISSVKQPEGFHKQTLFHTPLAELSALGISEGTSLGQTHYRKRSVFKVLIPHYADINI